MCVVALVIIGVAVAVEIVIHDEQARRWLQREILALALIDDDGAGEGPVERGARRHHVGAAEQCRAVVTIWRGEHLAIIELHRGAQGPAGDCIGDVAFHRELRQRQESEVQPHACSGDHCHIREGLRCIALQHSGDGVISGGNLQGVFAGDVRGGAEGAFGADGGDVGGQRQHHRFLRHNGSADFAQRFGEMHECADGGAHVLAEIREVERVEPVIDCVVVGVPVARLGGNLSGIVIILDAHDGSVALIPKARVIGEPRAVLHDLRDQVKIVHVDDGGDQIGQCVGIIDDAGIVGVQVDIWAVFCIPGNHVQVEHTEDVLACSSHITRVIIAAIHPLFFAGEEGQPNGVVKIQTGE